MTENKSFNSFFALKSRIVVRSKHPKKVEEKDNGKDLTSEMLVSKKEAIFPTASGEEKRSAKEVLADKMNEMKIVRKPEANRLPIFEMSISTEKMNAILIPIKSG